MRVLAMILAISPGLAVAQDELVALYGPVLAQCYAQADGVDAKTVCVGALALECMNEEDGGQTTIGMSMCNSAEAEFWDGLLNTEDQRASAWAKAHDGEEAKYFPE